MVTAGVASSTCPRRYDEVGNRVTYQDHRNSITTAYARNVLASAFLFFLTSGFIVHVPGCRKAQRPPPTPIRSPDGKYTLVTFINEARDDPTTYKCVGIIIRDARGVVHLEQTTASDRLGWRAAWDKEGRVWLESSDIGVYYWEREDDQTWKKVCHIPGEEPLPPF